MNSFERLLEFHAKHDQDSHGNWATGLAGKIFGRKKKKKDTETSSSPPKQDPKPKSKPKPESPPETKPAASPKPAAKPEPVRKWGPLGKPKSQYSEDELVSHLSIRQQKAPPGMTVERGTEPVGRYKFIKPRFAKKDSLSPDEITEIINRHGKRASKTESAAFLVVDPKRGFLEVSPHSAYQAYQRGMGDLMFGKDGDGFLKSLIETQTPLFVEKKSGRSGATYVYEIPNNKTHSLNVTADNGIIITISVGEVGGGFIPDIDTYNQKFWDQYRKDTKLPERPYMLEEVRAPYRPK